jgi:monovalent cation:H+ antiporter-2, CPA2 family
MIELAVLSAATPSDGSFHILTDLAVILCVAALTTVVFQRIKQPVVLGYLLAGMIVGPHLPIPLFANEQVAHTLSELGVILLMFSLGLEFSLRKLARIAATAGIIAGIECSMMLLLGQLTSRLLGWGSLEGWFAAAIVTISSTTIVVKAFAERGITGKLPEIVLGVLICEDLVGILLLAILTAVGSGASMSLSALALTAGKLAGFIVGLLVVGMLVIPRLVRVIVKLGRKETIIVANVGLCFGFALLARAFGYSVALGAFLGGALVSESGEAKAIEHLIEPVRDVFAAVFFVSVGMLINPVLIAQHWLLVVVLTAVVVFGKVLGVSIGTFLAGYGVRLSVQAGMSLAQIGEFSFIIAGLGLSLGATRHFLYPVAVAVSALTTLLTPWLIRGSDHVAAYVDKRLPHALQTYAALYGSWVERLRAPRPSAGGRGAIRRLAWRLCLDSAVLAALAIGTALAAPSVEALAQERIGIGPSLAHGLYLGFTLLLVSPFLFGAVRLARALGVALAAEALPSATDGVDLADASRRALRVGLQMGILLIAGGPLVAAVQPFYPQVPGLAVLLAAALLLVYLLWRSADNVHGHVQAGAQVILEALSTINQPAAAGERAAPPTDEQVRELVPGLGDACTIRLAPNSPAAGRSLRQIALRGRTGATVIAIRREPGGVVYPSADEVLRGGDWVVLTGSRESVGQAQELLACPASNL